MQLHIFVSGQLRFSDNRPGGDCLKTVETDVFNYALFKNSGNQRSLIMHCLKTVETRGL